MLFSVTVIQKNYCFFIIVLFPFIHQRFLPNVLRRPLGLITINTINNENDYL